MRPQQPKRGVTLVELIVSMAILVLLMGSVAWLAKYMSLFRVSSTNRLQLSKSLQQVLFIIENDLLSARRHTLGNVLCSNVTDPAWSAIFRTTSDPGFDLDLPRLSTAPTDTSRWYFQRLPLAVGKFGDFAGAAVTRSVRLRKSGAGSLGVWSSRNGTYSVRSPNIVGLRDGQEYVLAGWARGDFDPANSTTLTSRIRVVNGLGAVIASTQTNSTSWRYISARLPTTVSRTPPLNVFLEVINNNKPLRTLTGYFDNIVLTSTGTIADINFSAVTGQSPTDTNVDFNLENKFGMVFYRSDALSTPPGDMVEVDYTFSADDMRNFPIGTKPELNRFGTVPPYFRPDDGTVVWPNYTQRASLPNISSLKVSWVGGWAGGANRPIRIDATVRDPRDPSKTLSMERVIFPPTD